MVVDFVKRLIDLREENDMQQKDLAKVLHVSQSAISSYERGLSLPPAQTLIRIAEYFDVSVDYLLGVSHVRHLDAKIKCSPREAELISLYRTLSPEYKIRVDERIRTLADKQTIESDG